MPTNLEWIIEEPRSTDTLSRAYMYHQMPQSYPTEAGNFRGTVKIILEDIQRAIGWWADAALELEGEHDSFHRTSGRYHKLSLALEEASSEDLSLLDPKLEALQHDIKELLIDLPLEYLIRDRSESNLRENAYQSMTMGKLLLRPNGFSQDLQNARALTDKGQSADTSDIPEVYEVILAIEAKKPIGYKEGVLTIGDTQYMMQTFPRTAQEIIESNPYVPNDDTRITERAERTEGSYVLLVDDNPNNVVEIAHHLRHHQLIGATSALDALAFMRLAGEWGASPLAVVSDQFMPYMHGARFAQHVHELAPDIPFILNTNSSIAEGDQVAYASQGVTGFAPKKNHRRAAQMTLKQLNPY